MKWFVQALQVALSTTWSVVLCALLSVACSVGVESAFREPIRRANGQREQVRADLRSPSVDQAALTVRLAHGASKLREPDMIERWKAVGLGTIGGLIAALLWLWAWWLAWRHSVDHGWPARGKPLGALGRGMPLSCCVLVGLVLGVCGGADGLYRVLVAPSAPLINHYGFGTRGFGAVRDVLTPDLARAGIIVAGAWVSAFILRRAAIALVRDRLAVRTCARCSYLLGGFDKCPECGRIAGDGAIAQPPTGSFRRLWLRTLLAACMAMVLLGVAAWTLSLVRAYRAGAPGEAFTVRVPMDTAFELLGPYGEVVINLSLGDDRSVHAVASWKGHGERRAVVPPPASGLSNAGAARLFSPPVDAILVAVVYGDQDTGQGPADAGYCEVWVPGSTERAAPAAGAKP